MEGKKEESKLLLFTLVLILIILLLLNFWFSKSDESDIWQYDKIISASEIVYKGSEVVDRETYYILENIVSKYLQSYINVHNEDKEMYQDYYNYLKKEYKQHLSKREYIKVSENFLNKFYININSDYENMETQQIVKEIYEFEDNIYLCKLMSNRTKEIGYIAFQINKTEQAFNIVYIE